MSTAIAIKNLSKEFATGLGAGRVVAVKDLSLEVQEGQLYGFLGPNGAGKTTTIKILLGILYPTAGSCHVLGKCISSTEWFAPETVSPAIKKDIGYLPEGPYFHEFMTGWEVLQFYGRLYGMDRASLKVRMDEVLDEVGLTFAAKRIVKNYSKGMRQRLGLGQALLSDPKILIMDEPTTGLDPIARREIRDSLMRLGQAGRTLFICSHELAEVEIMCDRVAILRQGELVHEGRVVDLLYAEEATELQTKDLAPEVRAAFERDGCTVTEEQSGLIRIQLAKGSGQDVYAAIQALQNAGAPLLAMAPKRMTLEDLFIETVHQERTA